MQSNWKCALNLPTIFFESTIVRNVWSLRFAFVYDRPSLSLTITRIDDPQVVANLEGPIFGAAVVSCSRAKCGVILCQESRPLSLLAMLWALAYKLEDDSYSLPNSCFCRARELQTPPKERKDRSASSFCGFDWLKWSQCYLVFLTSYECKYLHGCITTCVAKTWKWTKAMAKEAAGHLI